MNILKLTRKQIKKLSKEEIDKVYDELNLIQEQIQENWDFSRDFEEYSEALNPTNKIKSLINFEKRLVKIPIMEDLDDIGDLMTIEKFVDCCKGGGFIDYDGYGYYSTQEKQSNIVILPSDITIIKEYRKDFTHIKWYNR